jgi:NAD(P)-dependent dehydrogenase (short-subunit alcohol dehydrogenase family)
VTVVGDGPMVAELRAAGSLAAPDVAVLVPPIEGAATPFADLDDEAFAAAWERPMRWAITALQAAHRAGARRIIVVVPDIGLTGGRDYAHVAATAEGLRATVKSAARQWGVSGITVNAIVVPSSAFGVDRAVAGPSSIAPPALAAAVPVVATIVSFAAGPAHHVTGQTLVADGGIVMP